MRAIKFNDIALQNAPLHDEINLAIKSVIDRSAFIKGEEVLQFEGELQTYLSAKQIVSCASGTDALIAAVRSLELDYGDEVIVPAFTFGATAEAVSMAGLVPRFADVEEGSFGIDILSAKKLVNGKTKAIIPVHLFGQSCDMKAVIEFAKEYNLYVIEDFAQALGAEYVYEGRTYKVGTLGDIGCTSFFPSKNLGAMGDGGAIVTNDDEIAVKLKMIVQHGSLDKYKHQMVGFNSRLDTIQAAVLSLKLKFLDEYISKRQSVASAYDRHLDACGFVERPVRLKESLHTFNQYTIKVSSCIRDDLKKHLFEAEIPSMVYYPHPLNKQQAFNNGYVDDCPVAECLSHLVLSLPIYPDLDAEQQQYIVENLLGYFQKR